VEDRTQELMDRTDDVAVDDIAEEALVEEVSIDGMCGVY
jgi:mycofactocin precursor